MQEQLEEQLMICWVCSQKFNDKEKTPLHVHCGHVFCKSCLATLIKNGDLKCPHCRTPFPKQHRGVSQFTKDYRTSKLLDIVKETENPKLLHCAQCPQKFPATTFCKDCGNLLCQNCQNDHVEESKTKYHTTCDLKLAFEERRNEVESATKENDDNVRKLKQYKSNIVVSKDHFMSENTNCVEEVKTKFEVMHKMLEEKQQEILKNLSKRRETVEKKYDKTIAEIEKDVSKRKQISLFISDIPNDNNEAFWTKSSVFLESLRSDKRMCQNPVEVCSVACSPVDHLQALERSIKDYAAEIPWMFLSAWRVEIEASTARRLIKSNIAVLRFTNRGGKQVRLDAKLSFEAVAKDAEGHDVDVWPIWCKTEGKPVLEEGAVEILCFPRKLSKHKVQVGLNRHDVNLANFAIEVEEDPSSRWLRNKFCPRFSSVRKKFPVGSLELKIDLGLYSKEDVYFELQVQIPERGEVSKITMIELTDLEMVTFPTDLPKVSIIECVLHNKLCCTSGDHHIPYSEPSNELKRFGFQFDSVRKVCILSDATEDKCLLVIQYKLPLRSPVVLYHNSVQVDSISGKDIKRLPESVPGPHFQIDRTRCSLRANVNEKGLCLTLNNKHENSSERGRYRNFRGSRATYSFLPERAEVSTYRVDIAMTLPDSLDTEGLMAEIGLCQDKFIDNEHIVSLHRDACAVIIALCKLHHSVCCIPVRHARTQEHHVLQRHYSLKVSLLFTIDTSRKIWQIADFTSGVPVVSIPLESYEQMWPTFALYPTTILKDEKLTLTPANYTHVDSFVNEGQRKADADEKNESKYKDRATETQGGRQGDEEGRDKTGQSPDRNSSEDEGQEMSLRQLIREHLCFLEEELDMFYLKDRFIEAEVFSDAEITSIPASDTRRRRSHQLLLMLSKKDEDALKAFLHVLLDANEYYVIQHLLEESKKTGAMIQRTASMNELNHRGYFNFRSSSDGFITSEFISSNTTLRQESSFSKESLGSEEMTAESEEENFQLAELPIFKVPETLMRDEEPQDVPGDDKESEPDCEETERDEAIPQAPTITATDVSKPENESEESDAFLSLDDKCCESTTSVDVEALKQACEEIKKREGKNCFHCYPSYQIGNENRPVLVLLEENSTPLKYDKYGEFDVVRRRYDFVSKEAAVVMNGLEFPENLLTLDEIKSVKKALQSSDITEKHSNITLISACPVRSMKGGQELEKGVCIVVHCLLKGYIPFGEEPFPRDINGIPVDVREGYCIFGMITQNEDDAVEMEDDPRNYLKPNPGPRSSDYNPKLLLGTGIGPVNGPYKGTLGGFVKLGNGKMGFLTCDHVIENSGGDIHISQPAGAAIHPSNNRVGYVCGKVVSRCREKGSQTEVGIDAALVEITDPLRIPDDGFFVNVDHLQIRSAGFSHDSVPTFTSGKTISFNGLTREQRQRSVFKWGSETGLTRGLVSLDGNYACSIHERMLLPDRSPMEFFNQMEIIPLDGRRFFDLGDSGSLVFISIGESELHCIGLAAGVTNYGSCVVTPIEYILEKFGVQFIQFQTLARYKPIQSRSNQSQLRPTLKPESNRRQRSNSM